MKCNNQWYLPSKVRWIFLSHFVMGYVVRGIRPIENLDLLPLFSALTDLKGELPDRGPTVQCSLTKWVKLVVFFKFERSIEKGWRDYRVAYFKNIIRFLIRLQYLGSFFHLKWKIQIETQIDVGSEKSESDTISRSATQKPLISNTMFDFIWKDEGNFAHFVFCEWSLNFGLRNQSLSKSDWMFKISDRKTHTSILVWYVLLWEFQVGETYSKLLF